MGSDDAGGYDIMEVFIIKFVLADVVIIAALLLAGPVYAVAITALLVVSVFLTWYLTQRVGTTEAAPSPSERDPVTKLQERYAAGDLSESEFEAALDRVIEANERAERAGVETADLGIERAPEPDTRTR
ncbi:MAG: SHOCT domain-containing protein [Halalkalicoccus sp.]